ncbi:hypothetical protein N4G70_07870 [Streptomyces sp. ASQP_92]|uniref:hypothetical protein n=1 Tax=Streptomyces sp. ASQP_92 TaxID=2979116 RepID=UPI0021C196E4|nr:hypothetical protein [Streptomyces sp. ASQP_92]MCT9088785.1 hypothetical protein [Streptomyces sp. ASQP_92]
MASAPVLAVVLIALEIGAGPSARAQTPEPMAAGHTHGASSVVQSPTAPLEATISEGQVKEVAPGGVIRYPSVTSCLTVTVRLRGGGLVGAHASLFQVPGELRSDRILPALKARVGGRPVLAIDVKGAVGAWHPSYFAKAIESYGDADPVPVPVGQDVEGLARAVADGLGRPRSLVTVRDVPDGDQIVR